MRSLRNNNQVEAGYLWATVGDQPLNRWALLMVAGTSNDLRLYTPSVGTCFDISAATGVTTFSRNVNVNADLYVRGRAVAIGP